MVEYIRVSIGTAALLGLTKIKMAAYPTTAYLMTYYSGKCLAQCSFCTQANISTTSSEYLSRVNWPKFKFNKVLEALSSNKYFKRICLQTLIYPNMIKDAVEIISILSKNVNLPISVSIHPRNLDDVKLLKKAGVERIGIGLDVATPELFEEIKKPFSWNRTLKIIEESAKTLGKGHVTCHLIYGLGDTDENFLKLISNLKEKGILTSLFAFTPMEGTPLENSHPPEPSKYRAIQLAHYLITNDIAKFSDFTFQNGELTGILVDKNVLKEVIESGEPFITRGCPNCNRPFYNESPRGPIYNYPTVEWARNDINIIKMQLKQILGEL